MAASGSGLPEAGWLDEGQLEALVELATESPDIFDREFERLDVLRKAQLRRFVYERHRQGGVLPAGFTLASKGERAAHTRESNTDAGELVCADGVHDRPTTSASGEAELDLDTETAADEPTEAQSPDDRAADDSTHVDEDTGAEDGANTGEALSLDDLPADGEDAEVDDLAALSDSGEVASLDDLTDAAAEVDSLDELMALDASSAAPAESMSLDDLFADSPSNDGDSDSLDALFASDDSAGDGGGDAMSLDDLFDGDDSGGGDMSLDDLMSMDAPVAAVEEVVVEEDADAGADYPIPADYGIAIPVDMSAEEMCDIVQPLPLYAGIEHDDLVAICEKMEAIRYEPGSLLCRDGDDGDVMWLVHQGGIRVLPQGKDLDIVKAEGVVVGEMSLLDGAVRSATLVCEGETIVLRFDLAAWTATFRDAPEAGLAFLRNLARMQQDEMRRTTEKAVAEAAAKAAIESEVKQAEETQKLALPDGMPDYFGDSDCAVIYTGARGVSGDYYDFIEFEDDPDRIIVIFADSTGHGLNAGLLMLLARSAAHTQARVDPSVSAITRAINDVICEVFGATLFMTYVCMLFDRNAKTIEYTNAGQQSHPYLYRMASGEFDPLASQTFQLGIQGGATYTSEVMQYAPGDLLVCYSDGIIEAPYCPPGATEVDRTQEFGDERIEALIIKTSEMEPQDVIDELQRQAREWCQFFDGHVTLGGVEHDGDDITNLVVRMR